MVLKDSFLHLTKEEPEMYLTIESAVRDAAFSIMDEEEKEEFYNELINDDYLGTSD